MFLITMGLSGFLNFTTLNTEGTSVFGTIDTDTTWDLAGSPYNVVDHITINDGATLTIEPGVLVRFTGTYRILVDGNITAIGAPGNRINITSNTNPPSRQQWNTIEVNPIGHVEFKYCDVSGATTALALESDYNNVTECNFYNNYWSIDLNSAWYNNISNNKISNSMYGIYAYSSRYNDFVNNSVTNSTWYGIRLWSSNYNNLNANYIYNNSRGIYLWSSSFENITNNNFVNNGIYIDGGSATSHNIPTNNIVNGKPLYYYKNQNELGINGISVGQLLLANCDNVLVENVEINNTDVGIEAIGCWNVTINNSDLSWNKINGIAIFSSSDVNITGNNVLGNTDYGIHLRSSGNTISGNNVSYNLRTGIRLFAADNNDIIGNDVIENNWNGMFIDSCWNTNIIGNNIWNNEMEGLGLDAAPNSNVSNNNFIKNGVIITGDQLIDYNSHTMPTNNLVNEKPLYYYKDLNGLIIDSMVVGQLILANCSNFKIMNLQIDYTDAGTEVAFSWDINFTNVDMFNNEYGFYFYSSSGIEISNCNASENERGIEARVSSYINITKCEFYDNGYAVIISQSDINQIYHNNFVNNTDQAYDNGNGNSWDNGYPLGGNYWSVYTGSDYFKGPNQNIPGNDGIGDSPYVIDGDSQDNYPLIFPSTFGVLENYTILKEGWNLISIPLIQVEQNLTRVLGSIDESYDAVQWYDAQILMFPGEIPK
jgi:parallel beta-helix repeat protein